MRAARRRTANKQTNKQCKGQAICWRTEIKVTPSKDGAQAKRASERTSSPIWAVACAAALVEFCSRCRCCSGDAAQRDHDAARAAHVLAAQAAVRALANALSLAQAE